MKRRRQRRGGRGRSRGLPSVNRAAQQLPGQGRGADREQPDRRGERAQRVGGGGRRTGQLAEHRGDGVKRRRVVQRVVGLDVAQLAHVGRRGLAGVEDEADRVGVPDGVPCARDRLPVRSPLTAANPIRARRAGRRRRRSARVRGERCRASASGRGSGSASCRQTGGDGGHDGKSKESGPCVPWDPERAERDDGQRDDAVGQRGPDGDRDGKGNLLARRRWLPALPAPTLLVALRRPSSLH